MSSTMLNFRKLKQGFPPGIIKEGRALFEGERVASAKILHIDHKSLRITGRILGQYDNPYESELEIDRLACELIDSNCDCPYHYDCQHLAALLFYLEDHLDQILVAYSKEVAEEKEELEEEDQELLEQFKAAENKESKRQEELYQKQLLQEYTAAAHLLASSPFFSPHDKDAVVQADCHLLFTWNPPLENRAEEKKDGKSYAEIQLMLRLPNRSKPLYVPHIREFFEAIRYKEPIFLGGRRYTFTLASFEEPQKGMIRRLMEHARFPENLPSEKLQRIAYIDGEELGIILSLLWAEASLKMPLSHGGEKELPVLEGVYRGGIETPLRYSPIPVALSFVLEYMGPPLSKILVNPRLVVYDEEIPLEEAQLFPCRHPGLLYKDVYYRFPEHITRRHLRSLKALEQLIIPEPLFGTFVENSLPELCRFAEVKSQQVIENFVTMPYVDTVQAKCVLSFLNGELEALIHFQYEGEAIPAIPFGVANVKQEGSRSHLKTFVTSQGILARNLIEEKKILEDLFQDFTYNGEQGVYVAKSEKKIIEFMTEILPRNQHRVAFNCPQNLLDQFIYDKTEFTVRLQASKQVGFYEIDLHVSGPLKGVKLELLWECVASKKTYIELETPHVKGKKQGEGTKLPKILILDLEKLARVIHLFDELGISLLENHKWERPLWSLANIEAEYFAGLPVDFSMSEPLIQIQKQMRGETLLTHSPVPEEVKALLYSYQIEGVKWLERLRSMYLGGILADDMGLGKTLQAIVAITQNHKGKKVPTLIVCPTSLVYNWKEELARFNPQLKALVIDGLPQVRKKLFKTMSEYDVLITSYNLLQKDLDNYTGFPLSYLILDEAQHIKNRGTRNAKSVKQVSSEHRLILSGTPIENSLEELWSLFDFLMPGFLGSYERFIEKYVRVGGEELSQNLAYLRKKIAPFILRRMKADVLEELPPISEIVYHCQLSPMQQELYRSYVQSAREELVRLVEKQGFERVQIHVLATLTRLKQICCHPAIFAKEKAEEGDSAKYDMLLDLLQTLVEGGHRTVIFSQYTRMLHIMREDFEQRGIRFAYLDGSSKNRLEVVKQFNEDEEIPVFLISLKAGGTGLNLVGADSVIHYDMWWNPAVESQATDRVHRMGQKQAVSSYKLITLGTIEEKIAAMQNSKKGLVKKVVSCDDEAISKLTWDDVLELLKT